MNIQNPVFVQLVDVNGMFKGIAEKLDVHKKGQLHLAFSVMLFKRDEKTPSFLLQKRANEKYHSGGLWSNTCCSHPLPNEQIETAATRRLNDELGIVAEQTLRRIDSLIYKHELDNQMIEHEYDIVLVGESNDVQYQINPDEVSEVRWWTKEGIDSALNQDSHQFTAWFPAVYKSVLSSLQC